MVTVPGCEIFLSIGVLTWLGFPRASGAQHQDVEAPPNPFAVGQLQDFGSLKTASGREVQVFYSGLQRKHGRPDTALETVVVPAGDFNVEQQTEAFLKGEFGIVRAVQLLFQGLAKSGEAELAELVE
jgi:hypothetical protein